jgi:hypothetical protein
VEIGTEEMKNEKAAGDGEILEDILKLIQKGGLKFIVQLINNE